MNDPLLATEIDAAMAYDRMMVPALFGQWTPVVAQAAGVGPGHRVLDVACGTGILAREASARAGTSGAVVGLDISRAMLEAARRIAPELEWRHGTAEALPFADGSFDVVVSQFGLMFFGDRTAALREAIRVLTPGGRLAFAVWDAIENNPAYADEVALVERLAGPGAAGPLRAPFSLGDAADLLDLAARAGIENPRLTTHRGIARFDSIRAMLEADLRGWLPVVGVVLDEDVIVQILDEGERSLARYAARDGRVEFECSALVVAASKPTSGHG